MAIRVDDKKCTACRICILTCPEPNAIRMLETRTVAIDDTRCKACLLCVAVCPRAALAKGEE